MNECISQGSIRLEEIFITRVQLKIIILLSSSKRLTVTARVAGSSFERKLAISSNSSYCIDKKKTKI